MYAPVNTLVPHRPNERKVGYYLPIKIGQAFFVKTYTCILLKYQKY